MYLAYVVEPSIYDNAWRDIAAICEQDKELRSKAQRLRRQLIDLERDAIAKGLLDSPSSIGTVFDWVFIIFSLLVYYFFFRWAKQKEFETLDVTFQSFDIKSAV